MTAAAPSADALAAPVDGLPGVGPVTAERLRRRGLGTVGALLGFLPRRYDDLRRVTPLADLAALPEGAVVLVSARVERVHVFPRRFLDVTLEEDGATVHARWFRVPGGMAKGFVRGETVILAGPLRRSGRGELELVHPAKVVVGAASAGGGAGIRPRYPQVEGVGGRVVEKIVAAAVERFADRAPDNMPADLAARLGLPALGEALRRLHRPSAEVGADELDALVTGDSAAHRRLALEDLLVVQLGLAQGRRQVRDEPGRACEADADGTLARVASALPFTLTAAQERVFVEIARDMASPRPMQRLLQGDVGSGKTAVAFAAAAQAWFSERGQTLLMAPTEVLAEQHARTLGAWGARLGIDVRFLSANTRRPERESLLALARAGRVGIVVGTQALLADAVLMPGLALAVIDEQHRFGVAQRARLRERGGLGTVPHLLVMTATPIPRTLALTVYGDLDVSTLDEQPAGRAAPATRLFLGEDERRAAFELVRAAVAAGRQAFVVCPVLEESSRAEAVTAVARHKELVVELAPARVGLVHGRMDARAKDKALRAFGEGALDVLVATTVVEVGIDVPRASLMVIEEADRFGVAQLHQLRGRVGRGAVPGECFLIASPGSSGSRDAIERLEVVRSTTNGFRLAEEDLRLRGPGDLFGVRQAGMPRLRFADLRSYAGLLEIARGESERLLADDPRLEKPERAGLRRAVQERWRDDEVYGEEAG